MNAFLKVRTGLVVTAFCGFVVTLNFLGCAGPASPPVDVIVALPQVTARVASATILVDYNGAAGDILWENGKPQCAFISPFVSGTFTDSRSGRLALKARSAGGFAGPIVLAACRMVPEDPDTTAEDLEKALKVRIVTAMDSEGKEIDLAAAAAGVGSGARLSANSFAEGRAGIESQRHQDPGGKPAPAAAVPAAKALKAATPAAALKKAVEGAQDHSVVATPQPAAVGKKVADEAAAIKQARATSAAERVRARIAERNPMGFKAGPADSSDSPPPLAEPEAGTSAGDNYDDSPGLDPNIAEYEITASVVSDVGPLGALQFEIDHLGSSGGFVGRGDGIDCLFLNGGIGAANYQGSRTAKVGMISIEGIETPSATITCAFRTAEKVGPSNFQVRVVDASDADGQPISPPQMSITQVVRR